MMRERRTPERLRTHYEVEKGLANRLRQAPPLLRRRLYASLYDELYQRIPDHPQLTRKETASKRQQAVDREFRRIRRFLKANSVFLEVGAGDCALAFQVAGMVKQVYAIDVSAEISRRASTPENFQLLLSDGCSVPVPPESVEVAYSNQLMEHLHPDDADQQLQNVFDALAPGGIYICLTPNRLSGPHDISKYFDPVATGFHLKEYTTTELSAQFKRAGFSRVAVLLGANGRNVLLPLLPFVLLEGILTKLPTWLQRRIASLLPIRWLLGIRLIGMK